MAGIRFSVVIPTYNQAELVVETVRSVLTQEYPAHEILVVDDGSTDGTAAALAAFEDRIRVIHQHNAGRCLARNAGIESATGDYVALLDHDDLLLSNTLAIYDRVLREYGSPPMLHGSALGFRGVPPATRAEGEERIERYPDFLAATDYSSWIGCSGFVIERRALLAVSGFFPYRYLFEDVDLCLRLGTVTPFVKIFRPRTYLYRELYEASGTHDWDRNKDGVNHLLRSESQGLYPGGAERRRERMRIILQYVRSVARSAAQAGFVADALGFYRRTFGEHLQQRRGRFLVGLPVEVAVGLVMSAVRHRAGSRPLGG